MIRFNKNLLRNFGVAFTNMVWLEWWVWWGKCSWPNIIQ